MKYIYRQRLVKYLNGILFLVMVSALASCTRFLEIEAPETELTDHAVFENEAALEAAAAFIFQSISLNQSHFASGAGNSITQMCAIAADEMEYIGTAQSQIEIASNRISPGNGYIRSFWTTGYQCIYYANSILDGLTRSKNISEAVRNRLKGEALFMRAFSHFYLLNCFGDIPLVTTANYQSNRSVSRTPVSSVYEAIQDDLAKAELLLPADFSAYNGERVRPNRWAAKVLIARVALFTGSWQKAITYSTDVINQTELFELLGSEHIGEVFSANSREAIWQLLPLYPTFSTYEGRNSVTSQLRLSERFIASFEDSDLRAAHWFNQGVFYKYKEGNRPSSNEPHEEYSMILRLAEAYLIRAEARLRLAEPDFDGARGDINVIRQRAGLDSVTAMDLDTLFACIESERSHEFFFEWGHRWFDLKRWDRMDSILTEIKPNWISTAAFWPIPEQEILTNAMLTQNTGY
ncbi:RagB/SusD family nutrient uptake outer membrane protein [Parapedobacter sp. 2B3]|uniref:RagB/SusD family nutrient uptake outer membrane protein n=1 Tax=Parapedobacter sp. 2B3 TaxID=3342381 RepID=UPI0035B65F43